MNGKRLQRQYKNHLSEFKSWKKKPHAKDWMIFPENMGRYLSIDETALSNGELYTVVTNKEAKGKKGSLVAMISGTKAEVLIQHLQKISLHLRRKVREITLDMAPNMKLAVAKCFPKVVQVTDRFHVQKLALEALQEMRIKHRWDAIDDENIAIKNAKEQGKAYTPKVYVNGDTKKQLLARSRYLLYKSPEKWTLSQKQRSEVLFQEYPDLQKAYQINHQLRSIYNTSTNKNIAMTKLAHWYKDIEDSGFRTFNTLARTIQLNYRTILNYFDNRSTNASAESFNAKIKAFRAQFRGVRNIDFFLFRLTQIFA